MRFPGRCPGLVCVAPLGQLAKLQSQGVALGFHRTPRWGWEGVFRRAASPLPFGLEARYTYGTFFKLTRRVGNGLFL
jgi:hypothetical protein